MKRILHLYKDFFPSKGGIQTAVRSIAELTPEFEHTVLIAGKQNKEYKIGNINVIAVRSYGDVLSLPFAPMYPLRAAVMMKGFDVVCVHYPFPLAELSLMLGGHERVVYFWHSEIVSQKKAKKFVDPLTRHWLKRADRIFVSYPDMAQRSILLRDVQEKVLLCPYSYERRADVKCPQFMAEGYGRFMLAVGRLVPYKGFKYLIEAMKYVHSDIRLVIAGGGVLYDELQAMIEADALGDRVQIVSGLDEAELNYLRMECAFFVFPSCMESEAFGIAQIEAMAHGKPVVNTKLSTGVTWVARDGIEALTAENENPADLAEKINILVHDGVLLRELSINAARRVCEVFSPEKHRENLMKYFGQI
jgi:glycosyltransferase involved in cell wall biosynthesis